MVTRVADSAEHRRYFGHQCFMRRTVAVVGADGIDDRLSMVLNEPGQLPKVSPPFTQRRKRVRQMSLTLACQRGCQGGRHGVNGFRIAWD